MWQRTSDIKPRRSENVSSLWAKKGRELLSCSRSFPHLNFLSRFRRKTPGPETRRPEFRFLLSLRTSDKLPILLEFLFVCFLVFKKSSKWGGLVRWFFKNASSFQIPWLFSWDSLTDLYRSGFEFPIDVIWADQSDDSREWSESFPSGPLGHSTHY